MTTDKISCIRDLLPGFYRFEIEHGTDDYADADCALLDEEQARKLHARLGELLT